MLPSILGTWSLQTHATSDFGLYKASAFLVMHVMQDPLQSYSCSLNNCDERENQICQRNLDQCVEMENTISQWSDVSIFFQFGFEVEAGTYPWRTHIVQNTSDWIGPYNVILPQHNYQIVSRYVTTIATDYLQPPINQTLVPASLFDPYAGATAVQTTIRRQRQLRPTEDPYEPQLGNCDHGDIHPILPQFTISQHKNFGFDFLLLSLPTPKESMYKTWLSVQKHLPEFPVVGPYCFQGDPHRAYAINISFDTVMNKNNTWVFTPGCVPTLPCWPTSSGPKPSGGGSDGPSNGSSIVWNAIANYGIYFLLFALVISLTVNCQLSYQIQHFREVIGRRTARRRLSTALTDEEIDSPLLSNNHMETEGESMITDSPDAATTVDNDDEQRLPLGDL